MSRPLISGGGSTVDVSHCAAPIVGEGWREGDEVPAWAVASDRPPEAWDRPVRAGVVPKHTRDWEGMIALAAEEGLPSAEGAPLVYWVEGPLAVRSRNALPECGHPRAVPRPGSFL